MSTVLHQRQLRIFISHKMPTDTELADRIGASLALYGGNQVRVVHAGKFRYGEKWRERIEQELDESDWLIFLSTESDEDWGFCLFECGYFSRTLEDRGRASGDGGAATADDPERARTRQLITFCRRADQISGALKEFNALEMNAAAVAALLDAIYRKPPWNINPGLDDKKIQETAQEILKAFQGADVVERNFDIAPGMTIELVLDEAMIQRLQKGQVPDDAPVRGTKDWQRLFGKDADTGAWRWRDLVSSWPFAHVYEFLIAKMMLDAVNSRSPKGTMMRAPSNEAFPRPGDLYRITLRRYERLGVGRHRFHFTLGPVDLPFDLPEAGREESVLFHLVNLTWYFRRRIVEKLYQRLLQVRAMQGEPQKTAAHELFEALGRELNEVIAQSIVRGLDSPLIFQQALGDNPAAQELAAQVAIYAECRDRILAALQEGPEKLPQVAADLYTMAEQNHRYYRIVAEGYSALASNLAPPPKPIGLGASLATA